MGNAGALKPLVESSREGRRDDRGRRPRSVLKPRSGSVPAAWLGSSKVSAMHFDEREEISLYLFIIYAQFTLRKYLG